MGRLISREELGNEADWYFADAYYSSGGGQQRYVYTWPNPSFPYSFCIHLDYLDNQKRILIRRWVENNISDTVIMDRLDMTYRRYYGEDRTWENSYEVRNVWLRFSFEDIDTALMFKTTFADLIKAPTKYHPDRPDDEEWCSLKSGER